VGPTEIRFIAITGLAIVTTINILGVKIGGVFSDLFTILKLAGIAFLIVAGLGFGTRNPFGDDAGLTDSPLSWASFAIAMVGVLWSYGGWQHASFTAGEARNPSRGVPVAMVAGAVIVTAVYLLANTAYLAILSPQQMGTSTRVASDAMDSAVGALGAGIISLAIFLSTFGSTGIYTLTVPRIYHAMASDGLFFRKVAELHPRYHTPAFAILLQSAWAAILILFWGTFSDVISYVVFTDWIFFGMAGAAVFVLRKKDPHRQRPYKTWGYPITPLIFVSVSLWFVVNTLIERPLQAWAGLVLLGLGIPVYHYWRRKNL
jgi:APA family basic amino acid/polyamine antiporter